LEERRAKVAQEEAQLRRFNKEVGDRIRAIDQQDDRLKRQVLRAVGMLDDYDHPLKDLPDWPQISSLVAGPDDPHYPAAPAATVAMPVDHAPANSTLTRSMPVSAPERRSRRLASEPRFGGN
jgi:hypothetical protein